MSGWAHASGPSWIRFHRFDTFAEAWARCPDILWIDWLVEELSNQGGGSDEAYAAFQQGTKVYETASKKAWEHGDGPMNATDKALEALRAHWDPYLEKVTQWLILFAEEHDCAVYVDTATVPTEGEDDASTATDT